MTVNFSIRGVIPPLLTPMNNGGAEVDIGALRAHVDWLIEKGVHGLMPCGTTGEGPLLTMQERRSVVEAVVDQTRHRVPVLAHVGATTTGETIALARHAQQVGADAASVIAPYFYRLTSQALVNHFCRVAESMPDMPVFLYNLPQLTGNHVTRAVVVEVLARCPNVVGIKDSSGDLATLSSFVGLNDGRFLVVCGSDARLLPALRAGAVASVSGNSNVFPEVVVGLFSAFWQGDMAGATHWQKQLDLARLAMGDGGDLAMYKRIAELRGRTMGSVRAPLPEPSAEAVRETAAKLASLLQTERIRLS